MKSLLMKLLDEEQVLYLFNIKLKLNRFLQKQLTRFKLTRSLYYLFTSSFSIEEQVVAAGINNFHFSDEGLYNSLRIDIHRIEKGLVMKPIRKIFAKGYIVQCTQNFIYLYNNSYLTASDINWSYDVLEDYFKNVDILDPEINKAKVLFDNTKIKREDVSLSKKEAPFVREKPNTLIDIEQLNTLAKYRRSVRIFEDKPVKNEVIDQAIEVASLSPSACNRLPYNFKIYQKGISEIFNEVVKLPPGAGSFKNHIPTIVAVIGNYNTFSYEGDRYNPITDASLATMGFIYGLEVQGVSSCILHWPEHVERETEARKILGLKDYQKVIMFIAIGYPDTKNKVAKSTKKEIEKLRSYH